MKVALVTPFDLAHPGGVAEHVSHLRTELRRLGHQVAVLAPRTRASTPRIPPDLDGVHAIGRTISIPTNGSRAQITLDASRFFQVRRLLRQERFDVVHVHAPLTPVLTWLALFGSDAANVATFHAYRASSAWYAALAPVLGQVVKRLDARIAVSEPARTFISRYFPGAYEIVPNGVDLDRFGPHVEPLPWARGGAPRILFVGRHDEPRKGFADLLQAMPAIWQRHPDARLIVAGDGEPARHRSATGGHLDPRIDFLGLVSPAELPRVYASCDLFCAPSTGQESFGIVLLEALASAKPVVTTNIPGYASVLTPDRDGLLVPPASPTGIACAVNRLLDNPGQRHALATAGVETARLYAWPRVAERVIEVYERARFLRTRESSRSESKDRESLTRE